MKKLTSLVLAVVSTMFLFAGATQAAEKFDSLARSAVPAISGSQDSMPDLPCVGNPDET
jgi:hypothetical protein